MRKKIINGKSHDHPNSQIEAVGTPNIVKVGENTYTCTLCNNVLVLTR